MKGEKAYLSSQFHQLLIIGSITLRHIHILRNNNNEICNKKI